MPLRFFYAPVCGGLLIPHVSLSPEYCSAMGETAKAFWTASLLSLSPFWRHGYACFYRLITGVTTNLFLVLGNHDSQAEANVSTSSSLAGLHHFCCVCVLLHSCVLHVCLSTNAAPCEWMKSFFLVSEWMKSRFCFSINSSLAFNPDPVDFSQLTPTTHAWESPIFLKEKNCSQQFRKFVVWSFFFEKWFEVDRKQYFTRHKLPCGWVLTWRHNTFWDCQVWYQLQSKTFCGSVTAQAWPQTGRLLLWQLQMASIDLCLFYHLRVTVCHRGLVENYYWSNLHDTYRFHI